MRLVFTGKPDKIFPDLVTGESYELTTTAFVAVIDGGEICPYSNISSFLDNWKKEETCEGCKYEENASTDCAFCSRIRYDYYTRAERIDRETCCNVAKNGVFFECSQCGAIDDGGGAGNYTLNFCPCCGRVIVPKYM